MLSVEHLTVEYDDVRALDDLDLVVGDGEIVCVVGPSGSGKSTLLRAIAGLERPTAGRILRDGTDLAPFAPHRRDLGLMFQDHTLFPHRDVLANVAFGPRMHGRSRHDAEQGALAMLERVGLAGYEHREITQLSGGEQQRVALARALAPSPSLLMLDEPLGALDRQLRERLVVEIGDLCRSIGQSVLFVTHDHDEAFGLGDRVAILDRGRIEQVGTPGAVWDRPATPGVARFLGWNVLGDADDAALVAALGHQGRVAVRPDALTLGPRGLVAGHVVARTFRRDHWMVRVVADRAGSALDVVVRAGTPPEIGERVHVQADPQGIVALGT